MKQPTYVIAVRMAVEEGAAAVAVLVAAAEEMLGRRARRRVAAEAVRSVDSISKRVGLRSKGG